MRFLVDESTGSAVAEWLRQQGHEVFSVYDEARGMGDDDIIEKAATENWILMTNDKDFGEKVYRERRPHKGVVLLRLDDERAVVKIKTIKQILASYADRLPEQFVVVTENSIRFARAQETVSALRETPGIYGQQLLATNGWTHEEMIRVLQRG